MRPANYSRAAQMQSEASCGSKGHWAISSSNGHRSNRVRFYEYSSDGGHDGAADREISPVASPYLVVGSVLSRMGERQLRESYSIFRENGNEEWAWTVADTQHWFTPESQSLQVCASIRSIDGGSSKRELLSPSLHHCVHQIDGKIRSYILPEDDSGNKLVPNPKQRPVLKKWSDDSAVHPHATILGSMVKPH